MKHLILLAGVVVSFATAGRIPVPRRINPLSQEMIDYINSINTTWKAGRNFDERTSLEYLKGLSGVLQDNQKHRLTQISHAVPSDIPESFDARKQWPECDSISIISDQGSCGSCWAVAVAGAMSDRICIASKGKVKAYLSAEDLMSCCGYCGRGCKGGFPHLAWKYWKTDGIVTGGLYGSKDGCKPYSIGPCEHRTNGSRPQCRDSSDTPKCDHMCREEYNVSYTNDKYYGVEWYLLEEDEQQIQTEIMTNGPVTGVYRVYEDFYSYKSGVYISNYDSSFDFHAVRILGWGVENGVKYWLAANSWNTNWGDNGYFKIIRGQDECGIEHNISAGIPRI